MRRTAALLALAVSLALPASALTQGPVTKTITKTFVLKSHATRSYSVSYNASLAAVLVPSSFTVASPSFKVTKSVGGGPLGINSSANFKKGGVHVIASGVTGDASNYKLIVRVSTGTLPAKTTLKLTLQVKPPTGT